MKNFKRFLLFVTALAAGGASGYLLLGDGPLDTLIFLAVCAMLGGVFHQIDKRICEKPEK